MQDGWPTDEDFDSAYEVAQGIRGRLLTELGVKHTTLSEWMGDALQTVGKEIPVFDATLREPVGSETRRQMAADFTGLAAKFLETAMMIQIGHSTTPLWDTDSEEMKAWARMMFAPELSKESPSHVLPSLVVTIGQILVQGDQPSSRELDELGGDLELANREHQILLFQYLAGCTGRALVVAVAAAGGLEELRAAVPR